jgi:hypothetical protein
MNNLAWTAYARMIIKNRLTLMGGYAETLKTWPGTYNPNPPLDIYPASKVSSINAGAKFDLNSDGRSLFSLSAQW